MFIIISRTTRINRFFFIVNTSCQGLSVFVFLASIADPDNFGKRMMVFHPVFFLRIQRKAAA
ncbi:MAG: hypothetical protein K6C08_14430 [Oscillospiraceae bacterium]|nr:hypothetical protein [Oscillospiraceae bacterium]